MRTHNANPHTPARPMPVRVSAHVEGTLRELGKIRNSANDEARNAISQYIAARILEPSFSAEVSHAERRFSRMVNAVANPGDVERVGSGSGGAPADGKQLSIRMDPTVQTQLTGLALIDDNSLADQIRRALDAYVEEQLQDPSVQEALQVLRLLESIDVSTARG